MLVNNQIEVYFSIENYNGVVLCDFVPIGKKIDEKEIKDYFIEKKKRISTKKYNGMVLCDIVSTDEKVMKKRGKIILFRKKER